MSSELTSARDALLAALLEAPLVRPSTNGMQPLEKARRHAYPQLGEYPTPCVWVGLTSIVPTSTGDLELDVPIVLAFDGSSAAQMKAIDENAAVAWDALADLDTAAGFARPTSGTVQRLGPEGSTTFGFVIACRVPLTTTTLCDPGHLAT